MAEIDTRARTTYVVAVRYEKPPVAGLAAGKWSLIEQSTDERRARDGARLLSSYVEQTGGAVAVVAERDGAPPRLVEIYGDEEPGEGIASVARTPASVRADFAAAMSEYWTAVLTSRADKRKAGPEARNVAGGRRRALAIGGGLAAALAISIFLRRAMSEAVSARLQAVRERETAAAEDAAHRAGDQYSAA